MRIFFAAEIDREIVAKVNDVIARLRRIDGSVTWVKPENHHITINFFGETDEMTAKGLERILEAAVGSVRPFRVSIRGVSGFPSLSRPRVIWVGIENPGGELGALFGSVREGVIADALPVKAADGDRGYTPHLTIGRVKSVCSRHLLEEARSLAEMPFGSCVVNEFVLFQSVLGTKGPVYTPLRTFHSG
jgi:RNA 2',3'-cyclic 3'-phosphodiesterase